MEQLPQFRYHPDPLRTGMIRQSEQQCAVCEQSRGYIYTGSVYSIKAIEHVCPWCIASGEAARKFNATFAEGFYSPHDKIPAAIINEVMERTPGYESWQGDVWLSHCDDACEFHGDADREDLKRIDPEERARLEYENPWMAEGWNEIVQSYQPGGQPAFYKFICKHCGVVLFHTDYT